MSLDGTPPRPTRPIHLLPSELSFEASSQDTYDAKIESPLGPAMSLDREDQKR